MQYPSMDTVILLVHGLSMYRTFLGWALFLFFSFPDDVQFEKF